MSSKVADARRLVAAAAAEREASRDPQARTVSVAARSELATRAPDLVAALLAELDAKEAQPDVHDEFDNELVGEARQLVADATSGPWEWDPDHRTLWGRGGTPGVYEYRHEVISVEHDGGCACRRMCELEVSIDDGNARLLEAAPRVTTGLLSIASTATARAETAEAAASLMRRERDHLALIVGELWDRPPAAGEERDTFDIGLAYSWGYLVMQLWRRLRDTTGDDNSDGGWVVGPLELDTPAETP